MRLFKVWSTTNGVNTIYSVSQQLTERSALFGEGFSNAIEETIEFSDEDIMSMNKMHVLTVKTGFTSDEILESIHRTIEKCEDNLFNELVWWANDKDREIINNWLKSK